MKEKTFSRDAILVLVAAFCYMSCSIMAMPIMAGLTKDLNGSEFIMGLITGLMNLVSLCMRPVAGNLADKIKKANLTIWGAAMMVVSNFVYIVAPNIGILAAARIVNGVGYALCTVSLSTWLSMLVVKDKVGKAMGIYGTMQAISMAIAGKIAVSIANKAGNKTAFFVATAFAVITFIIGFIVKDKGAPVKPVDGENKKIRILDINVLPVAIILMLFTIPYNATQGFIIEYTQLAGIPLDAGWFITMYAVFLIVLRVGFRNLFDKVPYWKFLMIGLVTSIISMSCLKFMSSYIVMAIGALCLASSYGVMCSVSQATAIKLAGGPQNRGVANSTYYMGFDTGMAMGPIVAGFLAGNFPIGMFYPLLMSCSVLAFVIYIIFYKKIKNA